MKKGKLATLVTAAAIGLGSLIGYNRYGGDLPEYDAQQVAATLV